MTDSVSGFESLPAHHQVALALVARDGRWLVARRHDHVHLGGYWEFPGGKLEPGESPEQAAERELLEECGVRAISLRALPPLHCDYGDRLVTLFPILCRWCDGEGEPLHSQECRWATPDELAALDMPPVNAQLVAGLRELSRPH